MTKHQREEDVVSFVDTFTCPRCAAVEEAITTIPKAVYASALGANKNSHHPLVGTTTQAEAKAALSKARDESIDAVGSKHFCRMTA